MNLFNICSYCIIYLSIKGAKMKALKLAELLRDYGGKWVALNRARTQVLASGRSLEDVLRSSDKIVSEKPIISFVSPLDLEFVG